MRSRYKKFICFFLMMITFVSGIYFENAKADVIFVYAQDTSLAESGAYLASESLLAPDAQMCTSEMLEGNSALGFIQAEGRIFKEKQDMRLTYSFLCQNQCLPGNSNLFRGKSGIFISFVSQMTLVASYIHESDGKKRL